MYGLIIDMCLIITGTSNKKEARVKAKANGNVKVKGNQTLK